MINIKNKVLCCGCGACSVACPKSCIEMKPDESGFFYPIAQHSECIDCGRCELVCPTADDSCNQQFFYEDKSKPWVMSDELRKLLIEGSKGTSAYAALNSDENVRSSSTSGGIFSALAEKIIDEGGIVYGAELDNNLKVVHSFAEKIEDIVKLRGSKYVQSDLQNTFAEVRKHLDDRRKVYFSGTPCQIEALLKYLGKKFDNLVTQDVICHGVPSPKEWQEYISSLSFTPSHILFRDKRLSWADYSFSAWDDEGNKITESRTDNKYLQRFLTDVALRPSCYECRFKKMHRMSDITLADFWGINDVRPSMNDDKGTSLVLVHSSKGQQLLNSIREKIIMSKEIKIEDAVAHNPSYLTSPIPYIKDHKKMKKILILGGGKADAALVFAAHRLGLYVITTGKRRDGVAHQFADEYVYADYGNNEEMLSLAKEKEVDYVCSGSTDAAIRATAYVAEKLNLPGHDSYETTLALHNKASFKALCKKLNLHSPESISFTDKEEAYLYIKNSGKQMIVKPVDNSGAFGVSLPKTDEEIMSSIEKAMENSKDKAIVVEPYIAGDYYRATSMIINQECVAFFPDAQLIYPEGINPNGKPFPEHSYNNGYVMPAPYRDEYASYIMDDITRIAKELHLVDGKFNMEMHFTPDHKAFIFDVARRFSGYGHPWAMCNRSTGLRWEDWVVRAECGMSLEDFPKGLVPSNYWHARCIYAPKNGILRKVTFDEYLTKRMYPEHDGTNFVMRDIFVTDHIHNEILTFQMFKFDSYEELTEISDPKNSSFYEHISFEYEEFTEN